MHFLTRTIKLYQGRIEDDIGSVTADAAANRVGSSVNGLPATYVREGCGLREQ
jgi:hypothetical protein